MKYIIIITCLSSFPFLHSMDLVPLLKNNLNQESEIYFKKTFSSLKLSKIGGHYDNLSFDCRGKVILHMSDNALRLHRIAMWLPKDVQRHIIAYMFGGYKMMMPVPMEDDKEQAEEDKQKIENIKKYNNKLDRAIERFFDKPIGKAIQLYYDIKQMIREEDSIAPIYVMNKENRKIFLSKLHPWYADYINPLMNVEERQQIDELDEDERRYFQGKQINKLPEDNQHECTLKKIGIMVALFGGGLILMEGFLMGGVYCIGGNYVCSEVFLGTAQGIGGCGLCMICGLACLNTSNFCNHCEKETL